MNFLLFAALLWLGIGMTILTQWKSLKTGGTAARWVFAGFAVTCLGLYVVYWSGLEIPGFTRYMIQHWVPVVKRITGGGAL